MKQKIIELTKIAIILCVGLIFTCGVLAENNSQKKIPDISNQTEQIETLINNRTSIMLSDENLKLRQNYISDLLYENENKTRALITEYRDNLRKINETYTSHRTQLDILETKIKEDGKLSVKVKETTYLTIAQNGIETGYSAGHEFIFDKNVSNEWIMIEDRQLEPIGILPLNQGEALVYKT